MSPWRDIQKTFVMEELTVPTLLSRKMYQRPILSFPRVVIQDRQRALVHLSAVWRINLGRIQRVTREPELIQQNSALD